MKNKWNEAWKDLFSGLTPEEEKDKNYLIEDEEEEQALLPGIGGGPAPEAEEADRGWQEPAKRPFARHWR